VYDIITEDLTKSNSIESFECKLRMYVQVYKHYSWVMGPSDEKYKSMHVQLSIFMCFVDFLSSITISKVLEP